jgi:hypothetical protein
MGSDFREKLSKLVSDVSLLRSISLLVADRPNQGTAHARKDRGFKDRMNPSGAKVLLVRIFEELLTSCSMSMLHMKIGMSCHCKPCCSSLAMWRNVNNGFVGFRCF